MSTGIPGLYNLIGRRPFGHQTSSQPIVYTSPRDATTKPRDTRYAYRVCIVSVHDHHPSITWAGGW